MITPFAKTNFRNEMRTFGIKDEDRRRHFYVLGKTGMGKTTLLENMAITDIRNGKGVGIVDPHGEFAEKILDFIPASRINDTIYFNPADLDYPISFNVMERVPPEKRHLIASGLIGVFKKIWADSWGPRLEYLLRNIILSLLEYPGSTLLGIMKMLVDNDYRNRVVEKITDPVIKSFWLDEYAKYHQQFQVEAIAPIQNKVGQFLTAPLIRNVVGQTRSSIDLREVIDQGKILILNLSKGQVGEDNSALLGAMMITKIQLAAMERVTVPEEERRDFYLYVDEFQNFATESFVNILSEARKYRLDLALAHQYIAQLEESVRDAVFGNVGTIVLFRVGADDAEFLEKEFLPQFSANDLVNLSKYEIYLKITIDGITSDPFSAVTLPPLPRPAKSHRDKIIRVSRDRYTISRKEIEEKLARWSGIEASNKPRAFSSKGSSEASKRFLGVCWNCEAETKVSFKPDNKRPIFCSACLEKAKKLVKQGKLPNIEALVLSKKELAPKTRKDGQGYVSLQEFAQKVKKGMSSQQDQKGTQDLKKVIREVLNSQPSKEGTTSSEETPLEQKGSIEPGQTIYFQ